MNAHLSSSWTEKWLKFDNSYFTTVEDPNADPELLKLQTDNALFLVRSSLHNIFVRCENIANKFKRRTTDSDLQL
jgi:hypothetical protein